MALDWGKVDWKNDWWKYALMGGATLVSPIVGGSILLGALANEEERQRVNQQQQDAESEHTATEAATDATWRKQMQESERQAGDIEAQIAELSRRAEANNESSIDQLKTAYGYDGRIGTAWSDYINNSTAARQSQGSYKQAAASSGLKNSGSIQTMGTMLDQNIAQAQQIQRDAIEGGLRANVSGIKDQWDSAQFTIGQAREDVANLREDWEGFNWDSFINPAGDSLNQQLYQTKRAALDASWTQQNRQFQYALEDSDPFNIWNIANGAKSGIDLGLNLFGKAMSFGMI
jgi:hypothetical protein